MRVTQSVGAKATGQRNLMLLPADPDLTHILGGRFPEERRLRLITHGAILLILFGNAFYAYRCIFQTREYIDQYGFGDGSAIMTKLVGTFAAGFAIVLAVALATSIEGAWLLFVYGFIQATIGALVCYRTINSHWGAVDGVKTSAEGYLAPIIIAVLNMIVLISGREFLFRGFI